MEKPSGLDDVARELLEILWNADEPTRIIQEMMEDRVDPEIVEARLRGLANRGLLTSQRAVYADPKRQFEDDWWHLTESGRTVIGA